MYELSQFRAVLIAEYQKDKKTTYEVLAGRYGVNQNYLWNIINNPDYEPPASICARLNIAKYELAKACTVCGEVHAYDRACEMQVTVKPKPIPRVRKWRDIREKDLIWALENRHETDWSMSDV